LTPEKVGILGMEEEEWDEDPVAEDDIICDTHRRGAGYVRRSPPAVMWCITAVSVRPGMPHHRRLPSAFWRTGGATPPSYAENSLSRRSQMNAF
jgi:hypothetical protein